MIIPPITAVERVPLSMGFRFTHEPLGTTDDKDWHRFVGRTAELDDLVSRIVLSNGGAFLLTGYRGVGKTTFVNRVIHEVRERLPKAEALVGPARVVDVSFNFARPLKPVELLYHVLRGLEQRLTELDLLRRLDPLLRQDLELACSRTSASVAIGNDVEAQRQLATGDIPLGVPWLRLPLPLKLQRSWKTVSRRDMTYLAYDEKAAEHDLISIAQRLARGYVADGPRWRWPWRGPERRIRLKMLMVFDELDKLEEGSSPKSRSPLDVVLSTLKNLFTTSGIAFIFVAGKDLHERWLEDLSKGDSIYESVFAYAQYLPGMWSDAERLCDSLIGDISGTAVGPDVANAYTVFRKYLAFRGRGIPRRALRGFNEFVRWDQAAPCLGFSPSDLRRFRFFAGLLDTLVAAEHELLGRYRGEGSVEQMDKRRLGLYYATDWILQREQQEFSLDDLVAASRRMSRLIAPVEEAAPVELQHLLDVLTRGEYLESASAGHSTLVAGVKIGPRPQQYRLPRRRLLELGAFLGVFEQEAHVLFKEAAPVAGPRVSASSSPTSDPPSWTLRYQVITQLGRGAMSTVYLARDLRSGQEVVVKELSPGLADDASIRRRAVSEGRLLGSFNHPGIVRVSDVWERDDSVAIVMEHVQGLSLGELLKHGPVKDLGVATRLMVDVTNALAYIHERGVIWRDPKPQNILVSRQGRVVLIDFGISRQAEASEHDTNVGTVIGTPGYMSPEQLRGDVVTTQSDIFSVGALFSEILTGQKLYPGSFADVALRIAGPEPPPRPSEIVPQAAGFDDVIAKCLAREPGDRWTAAQLLAALPAGASPPETLGTYVANLRRQEVEREDVGTVMGRPVPVPVPDTVLPTRVPETAKSVSEGTERPAFDAVLQGGPRLEIVGQNRSVALSFGSVCRIGRSLDNDIVLDDAAASRYAAVVRPGDTVLAATGEHTYYVEDLNSANGVFLNGVRVAGIQLLDDDDVVAVGSTRLRYRSA